MKRYTVPAERFFGDGDPDFPDFFGRGLLRDRAKCRRSIEQLTSRYGLQGKSVLSIGAGQGYEEYWLHRAGCSITIVDIDEYKSIEPCLAAWHAQPSSSTEMTYVIGDALQYLRERDTQFDVVYFSGFTPEEARRGEVQSRYAGPLPRRAQLQLAKLLGGSAPTWPNDADPFGPYETEAMRNRVRPGGLFISQIYYRGVPLQQNPHYLDRIQEQLRSLGLVLLTYYTFPYPYTDVGLAVAFKGSDDDARDYRAAIDSRPELTTFHGRSDVATGIVIHRLGRTALPP